MTNGEIKKETEQIYAKIKTLDDRLVELRNICQHTRTFKCNYSWRPGVVDVRSICKYCGEVFSI